MDASGLIATARRQAGLTQVELAARAGTSQPAVSAYEAGRRSPSVATLQRLLAACGARARVTLEKGSATALRNGPVGRRLSTRKREVRRTLAKHGARNPRVFGSVARGEDTDASDLDLLVDLPRASYVLLAQVSADLAEVLGNAVDVTTAPLLRDEIRARVLSEAVPL
ncbi:MAG: helix-turn-helix domain-containing protein [Actinomycetota bacterium]|jgi:predicted nucleotidyltransferase/DNA-binding XRE family transcriptional regulator|nr:helix-turn-helix domain-containing protein [Euzebyaceae bacterium]MDQ3452016.1 helix-turn-helix domain-containing protein [Actinomycetota bacterium]